MSAGSHAGPVTPDVESYMAVYEFSHFGSRATYKEMHIDRGRVFVREMRVEGAWPNEAELIKHVRTIYNGDNATRIDLMNNSAVLGINLHFIDLFEGDHEGRETAMESFEKTENTWTVNGAKCNVWQDTLNRNVCVTEDGILLKITGMSGSLEATKVTRGYGGPSEMYQVPADIPFEDRRVEQRAYRDRLREGMRKALDQ